MGKILLVASSAGLVVCEHISDSWREVRRGLGGQPVTSVIAREGVILAGTRDGVYRSDDLGSTWRRASDGLIATHVRWLALHPGISDLEFAGTEPAAIFVSRNGAETWRECQEVTQMREEFRWSLPYSPEAGCVRGFAFHGSRGYAAVEDGCVLISDDYGDTWRLALGSRGPADHRPSQHYVHSDVHSIEVHPASPDLVFAPTGGGFYHSTDGGTTWANIYPSCYCRAAWLDPNDQDHLVFGPADGVDWRGRIEETFDGGRTWHLASAGLEVPWGHHMVERFAHVDRELFAVLSNGELIASSLNVLNWQRVLPEVGGVTAVTALEA